MISSMRDAEATKARCFKSRLSKVLCDGREILEGREDWEIRRRQCFERDDYRCQYPRSSKRGRTEKCLTRLTWLTAEADHIEARWKRRDDRLANLRTVCAAHHRKRHNREPRFRWLAGVN